MATSLMKAEMLPLQSFRAEPASAGRPAQTSSARWQDAALLTIALWLFILVIFLPVLAERHKGQGWSSVALDGSTVFVSMLFAIPIFLIFRATIEWRFWPRLAVLGAAVLGAAISQTIFDFLFTGWVANNLVASWKALPRNMSRSYAAAFNYICAYGVNLALFQLLFARRRELAQERQLADARSMAQQAQLAALRFQLNPHFLFNTLNAISAMIVTQRNDEAEAMTDKLSSFLRVSLASDPTDLVPLANELSLLEDYLEIESIRFGERLEVEIDCRSEACDARIPSFLLQPLVENAIKYGVAPSRTPVHVRITGAMQDDELVITVADDGTAADIAVKTSSTGVGLDNVRRRLEAIYGPSARLETERRDPGFAATIHIPREILER